MDTLFEQISTISEKPNQKPPPPHPTPPHPPKKTMSSIGKYRVSCNNCGNTGHSYHQCPHPIISNGIIVFRQQKNTTTNTTPEYLIIRRRDTLGFVDFMRGKYSPYNKEYLINMIKQMTDDEKDRLLHWPFTKIWRHLWDSKSTECVEDTVAKDKLARLRAGIIGKEGDRYSMASLIEECNAMYRWTEPEWGFPKGRRNPNESDLECAIREFCEETGYQPQQLHAIGNIQPFEENFLGSNYKSYKHTYFLMYMTWEDSVSNHQIQTYEVSAAEWHSSEECLARIRSYNVEKRRVIREVEATLQSTTLLTTTTT